MSQTPSLRFEDLRAVFVNCTLKRSPESSHTDLLMQVSQRIMRSQGVSVDSIRLVDHDVAAGVYPDMRDRGWTEDAWPELWPRIEDADILVVGTPIWLGEKSSVCVQLVERLYAMSAMQNAKGQYLFYGKVAGCLVTGNEDGIKHVGMGLLYALQHIGYSIPPQADAGWIGEAGPGPSYGDPSPEGRAGFQNEFTQRNTTFMTWNVMHLARLLKDSGGFPAHGNQRRAWDAGERFGYADPE